VTPRRETEGFKLHFNFVWSIQNAGGQPNRPLVFSSFFPSFLFNIFGSGFLEKNLTYQYHPALALTALPSLSPVHTLSMAFADGFFFFVYSVLVCDLWIS